LFLSVKKIKFYDLLPRGNAIILANNMNSGDDSARINV